MTSITVQAIALSEAAYLLRRELGPLRNWTSFLTDNNRGRQHIEGHTLAPCALRHDGRSHRPVYAVADLRDFIIKVRRAVPSAGKVPVMTMGLAIDPAQNWRMNKFDKDGAPAARLWAIPGGHTSAHRTVVI